jgi:uncharacterized membrane protein
MWVLLSLGAMAFLAALILLIVPPGRAGVPPSVVIFYIFVCGAVFNLIYLKVQHVSLRVSTNLLPWIVGAALASFLGNLCHFKAINLAPNPGYACAIEASKALIVTLLSIALFASHFSPLKGLGVLCCAIGVALISL